MLNGIKPLHLRIIPDILIEDCHLHSDQATEENVDWCVEMIHLINLVDELMVLPFGKDRRYRYHPPFFYQSVEALERSFPGSWAVSEPGSECLDPISPVSLHNHHRG